MKSLLLFLLLPIFALQAADNTRLISRRSLKAVVALATGTPLIQSNGESWTVVIADGFTGTIKILVLMTDGTWQIYPTLNQTETGAGGVFPVPGAFAGVNVQVTTYTSGTANVDIYCLSPP